MNNGELIDILKTYPPDMRVMVDGYENGFDDLVPNLVKAKDVRLDVSEYWWDGSHCDVKDRPTKGGTVIRAIVLQRPNKYKQRTRP